MFVKGRWHPGHDRLLRFRFWYGFLGIDDVLIGNGCLGLLLSCKETGGGSIVGYPGCYCWEYRREFVTLKDEARARNCSGTEKCEIFGA